MPQGNIRLSIHDIFHMLDNKHLVFVIYSTMLIKKFELILSREDLPQDLKETISDYIESLKMLKTTGNEADVLLNETKPIIYAHLNPKEGYFDGNEVQEKMKHPVPRDQQKES